MSIPHDIIDGWPNVCGDEDRLCRWPVAGELYAPESPIAFDRVEAACAIALHMHQPQIPAGGDHLETAAIISNLQYMMEHQHIGDNHNAPVFRWCYQRMGEFVPSLLDEGREPRVMLDYSGTLLWGLRQMGAEDVFDALRRITTDPRRRRAVEWLGTAWGHAVAPSTPVQDFRLHVAAWRHHFAAIFGPEALARVRGFSPPEMALPNHPDVAYEFVRTLLDHGYEWVLVQEHTVEHPDSGAHPAEPHQPHRLVCHNSVGQTASILAIIKTKGSDTKLVGQMQPWYEARALRRRFFGGRSRPPLVTQISDGENGGVMMNEFPPKYHEVVREASGSPWPLMNVTEYLEFLRRDGWSPDQAPVIQPVFQKRIWDRVAPGSGPERVAAAIEDARREDHRFHMEGGSWTANISWVRGYENVLGPIERVSALFHQRVASAGVPSADPRYRRALVLLMLCETSCFRYWGQGVWTDYARELCRRAEEAILRDFPT
ncbi:MAG: glycosyl hydrolase family 57 [Kiritimatiellae bacterium]|nr:glycosyl hydrolase family 57 [Kiritimatiellia bacterium]